jgi:glutamate synthase (NADPH) small chain
MSKETNFRPLDRGGRANQKLVPYLKRAAADRVLDFDEVILGYTDESAILEASRCLQCPEPQACISSCPAGNDVPEAIWHISQGDFISAAKVFAASSPLPEVCGRVCPNLCQQGCVLGRRNGAASIGKLEAFVTDQARLAGALAIELPEKKTGKHVAVVGSGPAGITVAEEMIKKGHSVSVYEAWPEPGGVLIYGIPSFKLDKAIVMYKINDLEEAGVTFVTNTRIGEQITLDDLQAQYDAVFLGTGAGVEASMGIPGEDLPHVYKSTDFLIRTNLPEDLLPEGKKKRPFVGAKVAVIGGGDTAVDCARSAIRVGAKEVTIIYRRTEAEMPGNPTERGICLEEGVKINYLQAPVSYVANDAGVLAGMNIIYMELGEPDSSGRRRPVPIEGSEELVEIDTVLLAVGYWPDPDLGKKNEDLQTHKWGLVKTDKEGRTSRTGIFAAGDNVHGPDLVVTAIEDAKRAAVTILNYLN